MQLALCQTHDMESLIGVAREAWVREHVSRESLELLSKAGPEWTGIHDGETIGCGGFVELEGNAALAWALLRSDLSIGAAVKATKAALDGLRRAPYRWIEAQIVEGFEDAIRWVRILKFHPISSTRLFDGDGREFHRFVFRG